MTDGNISPERFASLIKPDTKMAIVTSASNVTGAIPPLDEIRAAIPESVLLVCDGAQGGGHFPLDMRKTGIDALALAGHKGMMGIQGSGALLFSERMNPQSVMFGGTGSESFSLDMPDFYPDALEAGTLAFPAVSSFFEGVVYLTAHGGEIRSKILSMTEYLLSGLKRFPGRPRLFAAQSLRDRRPRTRGDPIGISRAGTFGSLFHRRPRRTSLRPAHARGARHAGKRAGSRQSFRLQS